MKKIATLFFIILICSIIFAFHSNDSLKLGYKYKIITTNYWETTGILIAQDSVSITIRNDEVVYPIKRSLIKSISRPGEFNFTLSSVKKIKNCSIRNLSNDSIILEKNYKEIKLKVDKIEHITVVRPSYTGLTIGMGVLLGTVTGTGIGFMTGNSESGTSFGSSQGFSLDFSGLYIISGAIIGALVGGLTGGAIGAIISADEDYDLSKMSTQQKIIQLKEIIQ